MTPETALSSSLSNTLCNHGTLHHENCHGKWSTGRHSTSTEIEHSTRRRYAIFPDKHAKNRAQVHLSHNKRTRLSSTGPGTGASSGFTLNACDPLECVSKTFSHVSTLIVGGRMAAPPCSLCRAQRASAGAEENRQRRCHHGHFKRAVRLKREHGECACGASPARHRMTIEPANTTPNILLRGERVSSVA